MSTPSFKAHPWFRLYHEFATDHKIQMLSEADQRRYVMLLCLCCSNGNGTFHDSKTAFILRISSEEWETTKKRFIDLKLIDKNNVGVPKVQANSKSAPKDITGPEFCVYIELLSREENNCVWYTPEQLSVLYDNAENKKQFTEAFRK